MSHDRAQAKEGSLYGNQKGTKHERTEMLIGPEATTKQAWELFSNASKKFDCCASSAATPIVMTVFRDAYKSMKRRGIKIRCVTDITKENLKHCKDLMRYGEVRHISHLTGNFGAKQYLLNRG